MMLHNKFLIHYPEVVAARKANGMLYKELLQQARLASFYDVFALLAFLCIIIIPVLYLLKIKRVKISFLIFFNNNLFESNKITICSLI